MGGFIERDRFLQRLWAPVCLLVIALVAVLACEEVLRVRFPWDLNYWSESPFMTNMMKLDRHLPIYSSPAEANSFVYSPGLEYVCFALLKPFGLQLDVRFCRLISALLGVMAACFAALAITGVTRRLFSLQKPRVFFLVSWGVVVLVLFKNFMADMPHPDNIHAFHAVLVFWLCITALETRRFGLAILTMAIAGLGVFTKQTEALCFLGPAVALAIFNPWGWRRWLLLVAIGAGVFGISLGVLWSTSFGKFFTFALLSQQGIEFGKVFHLVSDLLRMDRAVLFLGGIIAVFSLWSLKGHARRYLICWMLVGIFTVLPNLTAYLKAMGVWNNLVIFQVWLILIVWPWFAMVMNELCNPEAETAEAPGVLWTRRTILMSFYVLMLLFLFLLLPFKPMLRSAHYAYCREIEALVRRDIEAGKKVLVAHGTEFLIHAGSREIPMDRANTILELQVGKHGDLAEMPARIKEHYYDRIYLTVAQWYGTKITDEINRYYAPTSVICGVPINDHDGFGTHGLMEDCQIMIPRIQEQKQAQ